MPDRDLIRAAISDAYYNARNDGLTMEHAADAATAKVMQILGEEEEALDDRIRDVMDRFAYAPHTCDMAPEQKGHESCAACLLIGLNKALLPGWNPPK